MKLYYGSKILVNVRIPYAWRKILIAKAKKEKATVNDIVSGMLKKKFGFFRFQNKIPKPNFAPQFGNE